ncbi:MAG: hypothetical protein WAK55_06550 [Xanthobacteraceae bacterium]
MAAALRPSAGLFENIVVDLLSIDEKIELACLAEIIAPRRAGDPARIIAGSDAVQTKLGWTSQYDDRPRSRLGEEAAARLHYKELRLTALAAHLRSFTEVLKSLKKLGSFCQNGGSLQPLREFTGIIRFRF